MKIKKLEIVNKTLLFLVTGTITLTSLGCGRQVSNTDIQIQKEINTDSNDNNKKLDSNESKSKKKKSIIKFESKYLDNTYGFVKKDISLRKEANKSSDKISNIKKYEKVKLISKSNGWDYVKYNGENGYIEDKNIKKILKEFIDVDISEQKLRYYDSNGNVIIKSDIVTGTDSDKTRRTNVGYFKIEYKIAGKTLVGRNNSYSSDVDYWMPFNLKEEEGLHDADRWRSSYGGDIYKNKGSHGCVNLPKEKAKKIFEKCSTGTRVLVHR